MRKVIQISVFAIFSITFANFGSAQKNPSPEDILNFYTKEVKLLNLKNGDTLVDIGAGGGAINGMYSIDFNSQPGFNNAKV